MTAAALIADLQGRRVCLTNDGESLGYDAPEGIVTVHDLAALREQKAALISLLIEPTGPYSDCHSDQWWQHRDGGFGTADPAIQICR